MPSVESQNRAAGVKLTDAKPMPINPCQQTPKERETKMTTTARTIPDPIDADLVEKLTRFGRQGPRALAATRKGAVAFNRLLEMAEQRDSGQIHRIALFIGGCWNGRRHFDLFDLRGLDEAIGDDMLAVLDALRWGYADIGRMIEGGDARIEAMLARWGMYGGEQTGQAIVCKG